MREVMECPICGKVVSMTHHHPFAKRTYRSRSELWPSLYSKIIVKLCGDCHFEMEKHIRHTEKVCVKTYSEIMPVPHAVIYRDSMNHFFSENDAGIPKIVYPQRKLIPVEHQGLLEFIKEFMVMPIGKYSVPREFCDRMKVLEYARNGKMINIPYVNEFLHTV